MLNCVVHGTPTQLPTLLIVHGLFGSARNWGVIAKRLSATRRVIAVDMRNHAHSAWSERHLYPDLAEDLADVIESFGAPMDVLGHSMGGKAAMVLALSRPDLLRRLVVADIAPVSYAHSQRHLIAAMRQVDLTSVNRRSDADAQLRAHVDDPSTRAFILQSIDVKEKRWLLNLDTLDRDMDAITGWPDIQGAHSGPVLFLSGGDSSYVDAEGRAAAKRYFPGAKFARIPGAGHWLHAEKPRAFEDTVRIYLDAAATDPVA